MLCLWILSREIELRSKFFKKFIIIFFIYIPNRFPSGAHQTTCHLLPVIRWSKSQKIFKDMRELLIAESIANFETQTITQSPLCAGGWWLCDFLCQINWEIFFSLLILVILVSCRSWLSLQKSYLTLPQKRIDNLTMNLIQITRLYRFY